MESWFDIVKLRYGYYVYGYVACLGGPYQTIEQCLDCLERMKTDTLRSFPGYELKNSQCRNEPGQAFGSREYPNSSSGT